MRFSILLSFMALLASASAAAVAPASAVGPPPPPINHGPTHIIPLKPGMSIDMVPAPGLCKFRLHVFQQCIPKNYGFQWAVETQTIGLPFTVFDGAGLPWEYPAGIGRIDSSDANSTEFRLNIHYDIVNIMMWFAHDTCQWSTEERQQPCGLCANVQPWTVPGRFPCDMKAVGNPIRFQTMDCQFQC